MLGLAKEKDAATCAEHQTFVERLCENCPEIGTVRTLAHSFIDLVRRKQAAGLEPWIEQALTCCVPEMKSFATGLERDKAAVVAGIALEWSNGQVEARVNCLKCLKRQMFGQANFDLLRARFCTRHDKSRVWCWINPPEVFMSQAVLVTE